MSVNKVILVGHVGKDPEVRHLDNNTAVGSFSLATTERGYTSRNGTEVPEKTEWHNIVVWRGLATLAENYIKKGMKLYIDGKIRTRSWEDQNGVRKYMTEIHAENIEMPSRTESSASAPPPSVSSAPPAPTPAPSVPTSAPVADNTVSEGTADDLPF